MERKSACTCGLLNLEVQREDRPITRASDGKYYLLLTEERRVEIIACRLCGGTDPDEEGWYSKGKPCTCQSLSSWVADPKLSVFYDEMMNEYSMHGLGLFYYCMLCGGRLPKSKRGSFFTEPTQADRDDFMQRTVD